MKPYAQQAEELRLALWADLVSAKDVTTWAEVTLLSLKDFDNELADLSMSTKKPRSILQSTLLKLGEGADSFQALRNLLGRMHEELLKNHSGMKKYAQVLEDLWIGNKYKLPKDLSFIAHVSDRLALAESGQYSSIEEVIDKFIQDTEPFLKFL